MNRAIDEVENGQVRAHARMHEWMSASAGADAGADFGVPLLLPLLPPRRCPPSCSCAATAPTRGALCGCCHRNRRRRCRCCLRRQVRLRLALTTLFSRTRSPSQLLPAAAALPPSAAAPHVGSLQRLREFGLADCCLQLEVLCLTHWASTCASLPLSFVVPAAGQDAHRVWHRRVLHCPRQRAVGVRLHGLAVGPGDRAPGGSLRKDRLACPPH